MLSAKILDIPRIMSTPFGSMQGAATTAFNGTGSAPHLRDRGTVTLVVKVIGARPLAVLRVKGCGMVHFGHEDPTATSDTNVTSLKESNPVTSGVASSSLATNAGNLDGRVVSP